MGTYGDWAWCLHCERIYPTEKWVANEWNCPAPDDCDGGALDVNDFGKRGGWPRAAYEHTELEALLASPVEGAWFPLYPPMDPEGRAKIGKTGHWGRADGKPIFIVDGHEPDQAKSGSKKQLVAGPWEGAPEQVEVRQLSTGRLLRRVVAAIGSEYEVQPLNPQKQKHRGRRCVVLGFVRDDIGNAMKVDVSFLDNGRRGRVDMSDLKAEGLTEEG